MGELKSPTLWTLYSFLPYICQNHTRSFSMIDQWIICCSRKSIHQTGGSQMVLLSYKQEAADCKVGLSGVQTLLYTTVPRLEILWVVLSLTITRKDKWPLKGWLSYQLFLFIWLHTALGGAAQVEYEGNFNSIFHRSSFPVNSCCHSGPMSNFRGNVSSNTLLVS